MKTKVLLIILTILTSNLKAQWNGAPGNIYYNSGNIGVGTSNPAYFKLDILDENKNEAGIQSKSTFGGYSGYSLVAYTSSYSGIPSYSNKVVLQTLDNPIVFSAFGTGSNNQIQFYTGGRTDLYKRMVLDQNGNLGIGTDNPQYFKLDILDVNRNEAGIQSKSTLGGNSGYSLVAYTSNYSEVPSYSNKVVLQTLDNPIVFSAIGTSSNNQIQFYTGGRTDSQKRMVLDENGNLGIGVLAPASYKLNVWGRVRAHELVINTTGADFVFEKDYSLTPLEQVASYIAQHKHLSEIPPAAEMQANGMQVGELQTKLLQKIEELTLYLIDQNRRIAELEKTVKELKSAE